MSIYLEQIASGMPANSMTAGLPNEYSVMPAFRPGDNPSDSVPLFKSLRLQQLKDLARAYGVDHNPNATKVGMERVMSNANDMGVFNKPPKNLYYFERAKYNADQIKQAKANGGFFEVQRNGQRFRVVCPVVLPWTGPDPEGDIKKPEYVPGERLKKSARENGAKSVIAQLRTQAKALGINSFAKNKEMLAREIAEKQGLISKEQPNE